MIFGTGIYSEPRADGETWLLQAAADRVYRCRDGCFPDEIELPAGDPITKGPVEFVQAFKKVLLFRPGATPLEWDGNLHTSFKYIVPAGAGTGTTLIPNASTAELIANRLLIPFNGDEIAVSDILDYTHYDASLSQFKVNSGTDEVIVRIFPFSQSSAVIFKDRSIFLLSNLYGNFGSNATLAQISQSVGCVAAKSVALVGGDLFFLSQGAVSRLTQVIEQRVQAVAAAVSYPITPLLERIHWPAASVAVGAMWGDYYRLAVPLDKATRNNAVLNFNAVTSQWDGYDLLPPGRSIDAFHRLPYLGRERLFAADHQAGCAYVCDEGQADIPAGVSLPIGMTVETRAYTVASPWEPKVVRGVSLNIASLNPTATVTLLPDGNSTPQELGAIERDPARYAVHGKPPYGLDNAGNDHGNPDREDYAWMADHAPIPKSGVLPGRLQESRQRFRSRVRTRWACVRVQGSGVHVRAARVESESGNKMIGRRFI